MELVERGAAEILEEKDLTGPTLISLLQRLTGDPARLAALGRAAASLAIRDANERIIAEILDLTGK